jgi:hypothetical protein
MSKFLADPLNSEPATATLQTELAMSDMKLKEALQKLESLASMHQEATQQLAKGKC